MNKYIPHKCQTIPFLQLHCDDEQNMWHHFSKSTLEPAFSHMPLREILSDDPWMLRVKTAGFHIHHCGLLSLCLSSGQIILTWYHESPLIWKSISQRDPQIDIIMSDAFKSHYIKTWKVEHIPTLNLIHLPNYLDFGHTVASSNDWRLFKTMSERFSLLSI